MTVTRVKWRSHKLEGCHTYEIRNGITFKKDVTFPTRVQLTTSSGNPWRLLGRSGGADIGGPFDSRQLEIEFRAAPTIGARFSGTTRVGEAQWLPSPSPSFTSVVSSASAARSTGSQNSVENAVKVATDQRLSAVELNALGAKAIQIVKPTNPTVDLAVSIAELLSERKFFSLPSTSQGVSGNYLNYMFGIAPTISDAKDLRTAISDREKIISQYRRDMGKRVRRSMHFPDEADITETKTSGVIPGYIGQGVDSRYYGAGDLTTTTTITRRTWFSGAFTYYYPEDGYGRTIAELDRLYGVRPDFGTVWELIPFSWLVDYKFSMGASIQNMASYVHDGLVMPYGYVMCHTEKTVHQKWTGPIRGTAGLLQQQSVEGTYKYVSKQRWPASPFGFGVLPQDLSPRQLSIIAALGIQMFKGK